MPKFDRYERFALHVAANPGLTRNDHRRGYLSNLAPLSQNFLIQDTISMGLIESVPVRGQRAHKLMPTRAFVREFMRLGLFSNDNSKVSAAA